LEVNIRKQVDVIMDTVVLIALTVLGVKMSKNHWKDQGKARKDIQISSGKTNIERGWST
jgi:hypothetical protein